MARTVLDQAIVPTPARSRRRRLGLPILYKVLILNSVIVAIGALVGTTLTLHLAKFLSNTYELVAIFAISGLVVSILVNWITLRAAFRPLSALEQTVDQVRQGDFDVRAEQGSTSDPHIDALTDAFNGMLDAVARYRAQLHELSMRVVTAQEEERKRISRELHDDTAQALTAQLLRLKALEASGRTVEPALLSDLIEMTAQTLESVRHMAHELRPPSLDDLGLHASLEGLVAQYQERFGLRVLLSAERPKRRLPPEVELTVYRIVQEALTNVAKHARATRAVVTLSVDPTRVLARVEDDGVGFDPTVRDLADGAGLGLFGMEERAMLIGGSLTIRSTPGSGTTVEVIAPLEPAAESSTREA